MVMVEARLTDVTNAVGTAMSMYVVLALILVVIQCALVAHLLSHVNNNPLDYKLCNPQTQKPQRNLRLYYDIVIPQLMIE